MYKDYFGFKEEPFSIAPDPQFLYMSERHREALAHLIYGMKADSGFVLLTGEVGTGKTTVCRCLLGQIPDDSEIAFILNPKLSVIELLATICDELKISYHDGRVSVKVFVDLINRFLLAAHAKGRQTVLIIDEAQNLSVDVLEQIRLLTNLETDKHKLLQVIMLGQPELNQILSQPELRQLAQRVTARYHLEPLLKEELEGYIRHRLSVAGVERPLFPRLSINKLYTLTGGVPRLINLLCDRALLGAYVKGQSTISPELLKEAAIEVFGRQLPTQQPSRLIQWIYVALLSLFLIVGIVFVAAFVRLSPHNSVAGDSETKVEIAPSEDLSLTWNHHEAAEKSSIMAYRTLFKRWGFGQVSLEQGAKNVAESLDLELINKRASLGRLKQLNRPAVLKIIDPQGGNFYATLIGLDDSTATLIIGTEIRQVAMTQLMQQWFGDYGLLWKPPQEYQRAVKPGESSPLVTWLDQQMAIINERDTGSASASRLDGLLLKEIKDFQKSSGVVADGVVGPHTLILINSRVDTERPTLNE